MERRLKQSLQRNLLLTQKHKLTCLTTNNLRNNHDIHIKKAEKGTTTVTMSRHDKIKEGQIQLDDLDNYRPLEQPMVEETAKKAKQIISELYQGNHINLITKK